METLEIIHELKAIREAVCSFCLSGEPNIATRYNILMLLSSMIEKVQSVDEKKILNDDCLTKPTSQEIEK